MRVLFSTVDCISSSDVFVFNLIKYTFIITIFEKMLQMIQCMNGLKL